MLNNRSTFRRQRAIFAYSGSRDPVTLTLTTTHVELPNYTGPFPRLAASGQLVASVTRGRAGKRKGGKGVEGKPYYSCAG